MENKNEWQPKRGDRVLVWDCDEKGITERYFLTEIKGSEFPFIVVSEDTEKEFLVNENFYPHFFRHMKPLKSEPVVEQDPFKAKVIALIESKIEIRNININNNVINQYYGLANINKHKRKELEDILKQIKELN
jgi:hypothetical protein